MKKLILALGFILVATLSSQAQNNYQKDIVGKWEIDIIALLEANNMSLEDENKATIEASLEKKFGSIRLDFTAEGQVSITQEGKVKTFPYEIKGETIIIDERPTKIKKLDKDHFVFLADGMYMALKKLH